MIVERRSGTMTDKIYTNSKFLRTVIEQHLRDLGDKTTQVYFTRVTLPNVIDKKLYHEDPPLILDEMWKWQETQYPNAGEHFQKMWKMANEKKDDDRT